MHQSKSGDEASFGSSLSRKACGRVRAEPSHQGTKRAFSTKQGEQSKQNGRRWNKNPERLPNYPYKPKGVRVTSPPDGFKQRSAFKTIRSASCDTLPSSPSIIKNNKNTNPHRKTKLLWGFFVILSVARNFVRLMDIFV